MEPLVEGKISTQEKHLTAKISKGNLWEEIKTALENSYQHANKPTKLFLEVRVKRDMMSPIGDVFEIDKNKVSRNGRDRNRVDNVELKCRDTPGDSRCKRGYSGKRQDHFRSEESSKVSSTDETSKSIKVFQMNCDHDSQKGIFTCQKMQDVDEISRSLTNSNGFQDDNPSSEWPRKLKAKDVNKYHHTKHTIKNREICDNKLKKSSGNGYQKHREGREMIKKCDFIRANHWPSKSSVNVVKAIGGNSKEKTKKISNQHDRPMKSTHVRHFNASRVEGQNINFSQSDQVWSDESNDYMSYSSDESNEYCQCGCNATREALVASTNHEINQGSSNTVMKTSSSSSSVEHLRSLSGNITMLSKKIVSSSIRYVPPVRKMAM